jgi:hypothetical protein
MMPYILESLLHGLPLYNQLNLTKGFSHVRPHRFVYSSCFAPLMETNDKLQAPQQLSGKLSYYCRLSGLFSIFGKFIFYFQ